MAHEVGLEQALRIAAQVERFVRTEIIPYERDERWGAALRLARTHVSRRLAAMRAGRQHLR